MGPTQAGMVLLDSKKEVPKVPRAEGAMPVKKLKDFLDDRGVKYVSIAHSKAYTAQEIAATTHIPGKEVAKTVMVKLDGKMAMAVLPSTRMLDLEMLRHQVEAESVTLSTENQFKAPRLSFETITLLAKPLEPRTAKASSG